MPAERTTMRQVREVLRLKFVGGAPTRKIARRIGVAASTVRTTMRRLQVAGLLDDLFARILVVSLPVASTTLSGTASRTVVLSMRTRPEPVLAEAVDNLVSVGCVGSVPRP